MNITLPMNIYELILNMQPRGNAGYDEQSFNYGYTRACVDVMHMLISEEDKLRESMLEDLRLKFGD